MDDRATNTARAGELRRALRPLVVLVAVLTLATALPWAGIGWCVMVGHSACPAILSPQYAGLPAPTREADARPSPGATVEATRQRDAGSPVPLPPASAGNRPTANPRYVALVIGNTNYPGENRLRNPGRDAVKIAETLKDLNYTIVSGQALLDADRSAMINALASFGQQAANATVALVYYAGHGIQIDEKEPIYLIPLDAKLQKKSLLPDEGVALSRVLNFLPNGPRQYGLVILDACRTAKYPLEGLDRDGRGTGLRGLKAVKAPNRAFVAFSASAGEEAADGSGENSPYAQALLKRMRDSDAPDIKTVFARVQDDFRGNDESQNPGHDDRLGDVKVRLAAARPLPPVGETFRECSACPEMVVLPPGRFLMGSPPGEAGRSNDEGPQRWVTLAQPVAVGKFEVTFAEWDACVADGGCGGYKPADFTWGRGTQPVINVSWGDAQAYVDWLSRKTFATYRLLSEAEWEYAARAGTTTAYPWGATASHEFANYGKDECCDGLAQGRDRWVNTAPVGSFPANRFGLHDMHGNVWEWTEDCLNESYAGAPSDGSAWRSGDCSRRVLRGGSWLIDPRILRSAARGRIDPAERSGLIGFRVARIF